MKPRSSSVKKPVRKVSDSPASKSILKKNATNEKNFGETHLGGEQPSEVRRAITYLLYFILSVFSDTWLLVSPQRKVKH